MHELHRDVLRIGARRAGTEGHQLAARVEPAGHGVGGSRDVSRVIGEILGRRPSAFEGVSDGPRRSRWCCACLAGARAGAYLAAHCHILAGPRAHRSLMCGAGSPLVRARSTSTSTPTASLTFSAPRKAVYGLIPNSDCRTEAVA